jgi:putative transcriptional regulator
MISARLNDILKERGRSLYWVQQQTGIAYTTLWRLRTGQANSISFPILDAICTQLECTPGELLVQVSGKAKAAARKGRR